MLTVLAIIMKEDEGWRISDLLDIENQPFAEDVELARQMLGTLESIQSMAQKGLVMEVRTPKPALHFIENTLSEWFEIVAEIEKEKGNLPYLIDRSLYPDGGIKWNQGLTKDDLKGWFGDTHLAPNGEHKMFIEFRKASKVADNGEPLSGYYNRILPVKFVLRMLAILVFNSEDWHKELGFSEVDGGAEIDFKEFRDKACKTAEYAGSYLQQIDKLQNFERGEGISIGFPTGSKKSQERFVSQFIGSKRKGKLSGALFEMGFANLGGLLGFHNNELHFTSEGFYFAMLSNPIIDQQKVSDRGVRFSDAEISFLVEHFRKNVPAEWNFMLQVANMIRDGKNRTTTMLSELIETREWDNAKASVMRSGAIARMQELGLVARERSGVDITYILTESGESLLVEQDEE